MRKLLPAIEGLQPLSLTLQYSSVMYCHGCVFQLQHQRGVWKCPKVPFSTTRPNTASRCKCKCATVSIRCSVSCQVLASTSGQSLGLSLSLSLPAFMGSFALLRPIGPIHLLHSPLQLLIRLLWVEHLLTPVGNIAGIKN